jgi:hypothetical protein
MRIKWRLLLPTVLLLLLGGPTLASANSSWHWVTMSPFVVFPFAVVFTLLIETAAIWKIARIPSLKKTLLVVGLSNLASFLAPYLFRAWRFIPTSGGFNLMGAFNKGPYYMILGGYLALTLLVEVPVVVWLLHRDLPEKTARTKLILTTVVANTVTTLLVAVCERLLCRGQW